MVFWFSEEKGNEIAFPNYASCFQKRKEKDKNEKSDQNPSKGFVYPFAF